MTRWLGIVGAAFSLALALTPRNADAQLLAGADFLCVSPQVINQGGAISFGTVAVNFGGSIIFNPGGQSFTLTQKGIYQIHLDGIFFFFTGSPPAIQVLLNGVAVAQWPSLFHTTATVAGDRLISANAGDVFALVPNVQTNLQPGNFCEMVVTQVQSPPPPPPPPSPAPQTGPPFQHGTPSPPSIIQWRRVDTP